MKTRTKSFVLVISLLLAATANAQVTIGSNSKPSPVALLDIKTQDNATGGVTSTQGGVLLPRVALQEINSLKPFIAGGGTAIDFSTNKGLTVYNLTTTSPFIEGFYIWNGAQWVTSSGVTASNGLSVTGSNVTLGGTLANPTTITGTAANKLTLNAPTTVSNNLSVTSNATVNGTVTASSLVVNYNASVAGSLGVGSNVSTGGYVWSNGGLYSRGGLLFSESNYTSTLWNSILGGAGETEYVNACGTGSGGFKFYRYSGVRTVATSDWIYLINGAGVTTSNSDRRIKTEIEDIKLGLSDVMKLRPVKYNIHPDRKYENGNFVLGEKSYPQIGFIAQEVEEVIPDAVTKPEKEEEIWGLSYERLIPVLTKALQEQQTQIEELEKRIEELEKSEK